MVVSAKVCELTNGFCGLYVVLYVGILMSPLTFPYIGTGKYYLQICHINR